MPKVTFNGTKINVEFTESSSRQQLNSGENISTLFGKIKKIFSDLKAVCFSGSYNDLSNKPSSLPANGGNADTVNGKITELSTYTNPSSFGVSRSDTADTIWQAIPYGSIYIDLVQNLTDTSWNFPSNVSNEYTIYIAKISKHRIAGMYLYPKTGGDIYCGFVAQDGSFSGKWRKMSNDIKKVEVTASTSDSGLIALPENSSRTYISVVANNCLAILYNEPNSGGQKILVVDGTFAAKTNFSLTFTAYYVEN